MKLKVKLLSPTAILPTYATDGAGGLDLYAGIRDNIMVACEVTPIKTGIAIEIPAEHVGIIKPRSGLAKVGVFVLGGVIDSDYRGEVVVMLQAYYSGTIIQHGDRIAQLLIVPCPRLEVVQVDELGDTVRGAGGFGSTGR